MPAAADRGLLHTTGTSGSAARCPGSTLHAVDDVSLTIGEREIVALAGESGSGKSTIARLLAKIYKPTSGEIYFQGKPLSADQVAPGPAALQRRLVADGVPGPVRVDQPGVPGVARGAARRSSCTAPSCPRDERCAEAVPGVRGGRADPGRRGAAALPARAERRPAAAGRLRPGTGHAAQADPGRRAGVHAGRVHPDRAAQHDGRAAGQPGRVDPVHHPRPGQRAVRGRPAGHHVRGPGGRVRARPRRCWPIRGTRTPSCCCPPPPTRGPRWAWARRPTAASRPRSSTRPRAAGSAERCPLAIDKCHQVTPELAQIVPGHQAACHVAQQGAEVKAFG